MLNYPCPPVGFQFKERGRWFVDVDSIEILKKAVSDDSH
jgi:hypothetical protein